MARWRSVCSTAVRSKGTPPNTISIGRRSAMLASNEGLHMVLDNLRDIIQIVHQPGALRRDLRLRRRMVGESQGCLHSVLAARADLHQAKLVFQDLHVATASSPGGGNDRRHTQQSRLSAHARTLSYEQSGKGQDVVHTIHPYAGQKRLQSRRRWCFTAQINTHTARQLLDQGHRISRGETRFATIMGGTPAHKAYDGIGLIGIDPLSPDNVWIGPKLGGMQVTPLMKTAVAKMAWPEILCEPGRGEDAVSEWQAEAVSQDGSFGICKGQMWHAEQSGRQRHGYSANSHCEIGAKPA